MEITDKMIKEEKEVHEAQEREVSEESLKIKLKELKDLMDKTNLIGLSRYLVDDCWMSVDLKRCNYCDKCGARTD